MTTPRTKKMLLVAASVTASGVAFACTHSQVTGFPDGPPYDGPDTSPTGFLDTDATPDGAPADAPDGSTDEDASDASDAGDASDEGG